MLLQMIFHIVRVSLVEDEDMEVRVSQGLGGETIKDPERRHSLHASNPSPPYISRSYDRTRRVPFSFHFMGPLLGTSPAAPCILLLLLRVHELKWSAEFMRRCFCA
ncbi:hypothetical protein GYMLUDRAFT_893595 [Collybiopsis luxurians FD-317 M1]|uniref:Uncharacterized protein n=1 Tax=Collybiopsis luxurians FD-317 M1 TaxID=944289 RepID=A0A0D0AVZ3_9AGAR|nr:hypothetical protein GYMLUDRAFT_893595 [Collybiopsis luxurians FD-317 M1]